MKRFLLTASFVTLLLSSAAASAGHEGRGKDKHDRDRHGQDDRHEHRHDHDDDRHERHDNGRHLGRIKHGYRRGERVPVVYLQPRYYVEDYRVHRLAAPPRGHRWVRPDNERYLLVEVASGLISQTLGY